MKNNNENYFSDIGVRNEELSEFSLKRIGKLSNAIRKQHEGAAGTLTSIIDQIGSNLDLDDIEDIFSRNGTDYTLLTCLNNDNIRWFPEILSFYQDSIVSDISRSGMSSIWRSVGVSDEGYKKKLVIRLLKAIMDDALPFYATEYNTYVPHHNTSIVIIRESQHIFGENSLLAQSSLQDFLLNSETDRATGGCRYVNEIDQEYRPDILFTWVMPLCHWAYLNGKPEKEIMKGAGEIIEGLARGYRIEDPEHLALFHRRCLAHIAMGFRGLMREIGFKKEDLKTLSVIDNDAFMMRDMRYVRLSPMSELSLGDQLSTVYHDLELLNEFDIEVDIDLLMDIEANKIIKSESVLGPAADLKPEYLNQAIKHPLWMQIEDIMLSNSCSKALPIDIQAAVFLRKASGKHFTISPEPKGPWNRAEQKHLLEKLADSNHLSMEMIEIIKPDGDILMKYKDKLPKEASRYAISQDLGI